MLSSMFFSCAVMTKNITTQKTTDFSRTSTVQYTEFFTDSSGRVFEKPRTKTYSDNYSLTRDVPHWWPSATPAELAMNVETAGLATKQAASADVARETGQAEVLTRMPDQYVKYDISYNGRYLGSTRLRGNSVYLPDQNRWAPRDVAERKGYILNKKNNW